MIEDFAQNWHLTTWDWLAFIIAILSFMVAGVSMIIAVKTLRSQRKTEENTTPIMTFQIQEFLLERLYVSLFDGYIRLKALSDVLARMDFEAYPLSDRVEDSVLPIDDIHCELYYRDKENYHKLRGLRDKVELYNRRLASFSRNLSSPSIVAASLKDELSELIDYNASIAKTWTKVMWFLFHYSDEQLNKLYIRIVKAVDTQDNHQAFHSKLDKDDVYVLVLSDEALQEQVIESMSFYMASEIEQLNGCMIPIKRS
jgi:hypothetical protein